MPVDAMSPRLPSLTSYRPAIQARHFAVSSGHYLATAAAFRILAQGGNAIDAGVAAGICLNVVLPDLTSFGGVAPIIVYHRASGELRSISGLGWWGKRASIGAFLREEGGQIPLGVRRSVVPGAPAAWLTALARYGTKSFAEVVAPALELCEQGFVVYPSLRRNLAKEADVIARWPSTAAIFLPGGAVPEVSDVLYQHDLARTFRRLIAAEERAAHRGRVAGIEAALDAFYRGDIAKEIVAFIQREGGFLDEDDFADFSVEVEEPPSVTYRDVTVYGCGPWCQGPVLLETLNILEGFDLKAMGHNTPDYIHTVIGALDLAFADREAYVGDPRFVDVPLATLLSKEYAARQRGRIRPDQTWVEMPAPGLGAGARKAPAAGGSDTPPQPDTSYVCVVDAEGNAFSATPSDGIGSTPVVPGLGLLCSGRGSQSWLDPDHSSSLQPRKRPRLTPNPALAFKDDRLFMVFGTPGADVQPQSMLQVFLNIVEFEMDPQQAIEAPRFATYNYPESFWPHTYRPGLRQIERRVPESTIEELRRRGHRIEPWPEWTRVAGNVCVILVDQARETLTAGADARAEAYALGW
jgi:gamma-glutamyltranspeptidase/glutathione hydrolase